MTEMTDKGMIEAVLHRYFEALYRGDTGLFSDVFHPSARLHTVSGDGVTVIEVPAYLDIVANRAAPAASRAPRQEEILSIEIPTPTTAHARVRERFFNKLFTDELVLVKVGGDWKIVSKVWDFVLLDA